VRESESSHARAIIDRGVVIMAERELAMISRTILHDSTSYRQLSYSTLAGFSSGGNWMVLLVCVRGRLDQPESRGGGGHT
jgi:hypothetical protein